MTTLLPGFDDQLSARAEALARRSRRPWRRWHGAGAMLVALLSAGGVAYASKGLWSPQLGDERRGHPTATASELPAEQLAAFGVLRREQTERDRGAASLYALKMQSQSIGSIRTAAVRRVDRTADEGHAIVLIPAVQGEQTASKKPQDRDRLCLWLRDPVDGGGQSCGTTAEAIAGKLSMAMLPPPKLTANQQARLSAYLKVARAKAKREGSHSMMIPGELGRPPGSEQPGQLVGLVPDGVASVRVGSGKAAQTVPVVDNVYVAEAILEGDAFEGKPVWLTADGKVYPALREQAVQSYLPRPEWANDAAAAEERRLRALRGGG